MGTLALGAANRIPDSAPLRVRLAARSISVGSAKRSATLLLDGGTVIGAARSTWRMSTCGRRAFGRGLGDGRVSQKSAAPWTLANLTYAGDTFIDAARSR